MMRGRIILALVAAIAATAVTVTADAAKQRTMACDPFTYPPIVNGSPPNRRSFGDGFVQNSCIDSVWSYYLKLANAGGSPLIDKTGNSFGNDYVFTQSVVCEGASIHNYLYINVGGMGKSHTSGNANPNCTY